MSKTLKEKKVIVIDIDGCVKDIFYEQLDNKELPNFSEITKNSCRYDEAVTIFPSETMEAQVSLFTGNYPKNHHIFANLWFDRKSQNLTQRAYTDEVKDAANVYGYEPFGFPNILMPDSKNGGLINSDLNKNIKTIYELLTKEGLTSRVIFNQISKGATEWIRPSREQCLRHLLVDKVLSNYPIGVWFGGYERSMIDETINSVEKNGLPNLLTLYFGENDASNHRRGTKTQIKYSKHIDFQLGRFIKKVKELSPIEEIYWVITSDHGQIDVYKDYEHAISYDKFLEVLKPLGEFKKAGLKIKKEDNLVIFLGLTTRIFLKNRKTNSWRDFPEKEDVLKTADLISKNLGEYIDFILIYEKENFSVFDDRNLISLDSFFKDKNDEYPLAIERLMGFANIIAGDIVILSNYKKGFYFSTKTYAANHGHLSKGDSYIPLIFSGPGIKEKKLKVARIIDIAPTIASIFNLEMPTADGKPLNIF